MLDQPFMWVLLCATLQLVVSYLPISSGLLKKSGAHRLAVVYSIYWTAALIGAIVLVLDPPTAHSWAGAYSAIVGLLLGLPWSFLLQNSFVARWVDLLPLPHNAAGLIVCWIGIGINQTICFALCGLYWLSGEKSRRAAS